MKKTKKGIVIFGIVEGYFHDNGGKQENDVNEMIELTEILKNISVEIEKETTIYISGVLTPVNVLYKTEWGCPVGGEKCYKFESTCNPAFVDSQEIWESSFLQFSQKVKKTFKQSTVTVEFVDVNLQYLTD